MSQRRAEDNGVNVVTIFFRLEQRLEQECTRAISDSGKGIELTPSRVNCAEDRDGTGDRCIAFAGDQALARNMNGGDSRGARALHGETRPYKAENL